MSSSDYISEDSEFEQQSIIKNGEKVEAINLKLMVVPQQQI